MRRNFSVPLVFAGGIGAISTGSILVRYAQAHVDSSVAVFYRLALSAIVLVPIAVWYARRHRLRVAVTDAMWSAVAGVLLALHFVTWFRSLETTTVASSVVLVSASPLFVALLAPLILGERITRRTVAGIVVAIAGAAVVALARGGETSWIGPALGGNALALTGAAMIAGYLLIARHVQRRVPFIAFVAMTFSWAALAALGFVALAGASLTAIPRPAWPWLVLLALVPQLLGHSTINWALRRLPSASVAVGTLAEPIGAVALAWIVLGEPPTALEALGAAVLLAGIALVVVPRRSVERVRQQA